MPPRSGDLGDSPANAWLGDCVVADFSTVVSPSRIEFVVTGDRLFAAMRDSARVPADMPLPPRRPQVGAMPLSAPAEALAAPRRARAAVIVVFPGPRFGPRATGGSRLRRGLLPVCRAGHVRHGRRAPFMPITYRCRRSGLRRRHEFYAAERLAVALHHICKQKSWRHGCSLAESAQRFVSASSHRAASAAAMWRRWSGEVSA